MLPLAHNLPEGQSPLLEPFWLSSKSSMTQAGQVEAASLSPTEAFRLPDGTCLSCQQTHTGALPVMLLSAELGCCIAAVFCA